ncbi:DUF1214 domain-containing protein [Kaarinaea lacus]
MKKILSTILVAFFALSTGLSFAKELTDKEIDNIVRRTYQYIAMYNVINNFALNENNPMSTGGWNKSYMPKALTDHTVQAIARPNNDTLYVITMLDLRNDPVVVYYPAFDSKFVSLETSAYDHYVNIPLSTTKGDFKKPVTMLYYTDRTQGYKGEKVKGVDKYMKMSGDFAVAFMRIMPHAAEPERLKKNLATMKTITVKTLSEFLGKPAKPVAKTEFPPFGRDADLYEKNGRYVMQFVFNHTTFDPNDKMDQAVLAAMKPLGVQPGQFFNVSNLPALGSPAIQWKSEIKLDESDGKRFRATAEKIAQESLAIWNSPKGNPYLFDVFKPKGKMTLEPMVVQSAVGPIGNPADQAMYPGIVTTDGKPMNAMNDYVIRMSKDQLPPALAFWSATLYDSKNGFFIPNDRKKYSVGENGGMKLDDKGGIAIYIAAEKPKGVPEENWLPINRKDQGLDIIMRVYQPDLKKMKTWQAPKAEKL